MTSSYETDRNEFAVEALDGASCSPRAKELAIGAIAEAHHGGTPETWRSGVTGRCGHGEGTLEALREAEECMRSSGLWPWNG